MPPPSVTLHGGSFADGRRCRICLSQTGNRGIRCWLEVKPDVRRVLRGFGELFGSLCVVLLLLPHFEYISGDEPSARQHKTQRRARVLITVRISEFAYPFLQIRNTIQWLRAAPHRLSSSTTQFCPLYLQRKYLSCRGSRGSIFHLDE